MLGRLNAMNGISRGALIIAGVKDCITNADIAFKNITLLDAAMVVPWIRSAGRHANEHGDTVILFIDKQAFGRDAINADFFPCAFVGRHR